MYIKDCRINYLHVITIPNIDILPVVKQFYPDAVTLEGLMHNVVQSIFNEYDYTTNQILLANSKG